MSELRQELLKHFTEVVLKTASKLQSWNDAKPETSSHIPTVPTCDDFGLKLYHIMRELTPEEVAIYVHCRSYCVITQHYGNHL